MTISVSSLDDLREASGGTVIDDPDLVASYSADRADLVVPGKALAACFPTSTEGVSGAMAWASRHGVPVVPRGAGTGLSGGAAAIDSCLVLSLERMNRITEIAPDDQLAVCEAGVINAEVTRQASAHGLWYPPDPSSFEISTIGGNLATNAGGLRCVKYGVTRDSVLGLEVVLSDGRVLATGGRAVKNNAGYDLTRLFIGSEGTLGVITAATLRLRPAPARAAVTFVANFPSLTSAGAAVSAIIGQGLQPSLLELMDSQMVNAIEDFRRHDLDRSAAAVLLGQSDAWDQAGQVQAMARCCEAAGATFVVASDDEEEGDMLLEARRSALPAISRLGRTMIEDVGVPRSRLPEMLLEVEKVAAAHEITIATVGHAGDGNLHPTLVLPPGDGGIDRVMAAARDICEAALALGGTITGEHGVGSLKRAWLAGELDDNALWAHRAVKAALDPAGLLNPGKAF
ncbi:MAG: FAD-binding oxidoreductase [Acidimicrobiales bacterium]